MGEQGNRCSRAYHRGIYRGKGVSAPNKESPIDLTLVSEELAGIEICEVCRKSVLFSDHYPITVKAGLEVQQQKKKNGDCTKLIRIPSKYYVKDGVAFQLENIYNMGMN